MVWKLKEHSLTFIDILFKDGNFRRFYSLDWPHRYSKIRDKELGLTRLRNLLNRYGSLVEWAVIMDNDGSGKVLERYEGGFKIN